MIEGIKNTDFDDLSEFADYLAEFETIIGFDSETCPACGIKLSEALSILKSNSFAVYKTFTDESEFLNNITELSVNKIPYKTDVNSDTLILDPTHQSFSILLPIEYITQLEKQKV